MNFVKTFIVSFVFLTVLTGCSDLFKTSAGSQSNQNMEEIEYGRKLVLIMGCNDCHTPKGISGVYGPEDDWLVGDDLGFNGPYGTQYPTNLRLLLNKISMDEWVVLAQKMRKDSPMAWSQLPQLDTKDLRAIFSFVRYLGPKGVPAPASLGPGIEPQTRYFYFPLPH